MEMQRIKNHKNNLGEQRKITGSTKHEDLWYNYGNKEVDQWNRIENLNMGMWNHECKNA